MGIRSQIASISSSVRNAFSVKKDYAVPDVGAGGFSAWLGYMAGGYGAPREPFTGAWQQNLDQARSAGPNLFANSAVFTCTNIISSDIASLPLRVLILNPDTGIREPHMNHPAWALLQNPNGFQTSLQFVQNYLTSKLIHGNVYVLMMRDARNVVNEMHVLNPSRVQPLVADDGSIFYRLREDKLAGIKELTIAARDIIHDRAMTLWHPLVGMSPLFAAGMSALMASRIQMSSENFFANMARTSGVLVAPGKIDPAVAKKLQNEWEANYSGRGLGRTAVLSNGLEYKPLTVNAADSELVNQLRWTIEDIARVYRVPPYMVGEMSKATYRNSEQMARDYFRQCLAYHLRAFEQAMTNGLSLALGVEVSFDLSDLFRMEADIRYANHQIALNAGFKAINEVRKEEDLPPVPGGDEPRVQMQYVPLTLADTIAQAKLTAPPAPPSPPAPAPASPAPAPTPAKTADDTESQLELDFTPIQMSMLVDAFVERFDLGDSNGA